jgi:phage baseplate assembly protein W
MAEDPLVSESEPLIRRLIGYGARYPWRFDGSGGVSAVKLSGGLDKINGSIRHILSTYLGERFFQPDFGCNLRSLVFEPNDEIFRQTAHFYTVGALREWEKRIIVESVVFDEDPELMDQSTVYIFIEYRLINSQVRGNYVFPWYRGPRPVDGD